MGKMTAVYHSADEYILSQPEQSRASLELIRQTVRLAVPDAQEAISYQMPAFKFHGMLCFYAVFKDHYSLFVSPEIHKAFVDELKGFKTTKSAIHFPFDRPVPVELIVQIVRFAAITNLEKAEARLKKRKR